jgi:hypothetical protein
MTEYLYEMKPDSLMMFTQEHLFSMLTLEIYKLIVNCIELYLLLLYYVLTIVLCILLRMTTDCYNHITCLMTCFISRCPLWVLIWIDEIYLYKYFMLYQRTGTVFLHRSQ